MHWRKVAKGSSLAELLIAVVVLGICSAVILQAVTTSVKRSLAAEQRQVAADACFTALDTVRSQNQGTTIKTGSSVVTIAAPGTTISITTTVSAPAGGSSAYPISAVATWPTSSGSDIVTLSTYVRVPDA